MGRAPPESLADSGFEGNSDQLLDLVGSELQIVQDIFPQIQTCSGGELFQRDTSTRAETETWLRILCKQRRP